MRSRVSLWCAIALGLTLAGPVLRAHGQEAAYEQEPIDYLKAPVNDPVARLQKRIEARTVTLAHDGRHGYLEAVLQALDVDPASQVLVFSKTSFQRDRITPKAPRALYFNDSVYVGWVQSGDVLELSAVDPQQGAVFYLLDQSPTEKPAFQRYTHDCLQCHASGKTRDVPGHLVRSVFPLRSGQPAYNAGTFTTSHESPLSERWGGWYVTGTHGAMTHMGNVFVTDADNPEKLDTAAGANVTDLSGRLAIDHYLRPTSDIVALMVLEHQTQTQNLDVPASNVGEALEELARRCPALAGTVILGRTIHPAYRLSINGDRFETDPEARLGEGDSLLLLAADVGG